MKRLLTALVLLVTTLTTARAGGLHATLEGPAKDGVTYTVRALPSAPDVVLEPWVIAEGLYDGKRVSWRLRLKPTSQHGVYTFQRGWPERGDWMLRVNLGGPPAPVTVATLTRDGRVGENQLYWNSYGVQECNRALAEIAKAKGIKLEDHC